MKIMVTGGHFTPALALIEGLKNNYQFVFVGRQFSQEKNALSLEYQEISRLKIPFYNLESGRFNRQCFKLITGLDRARTILEKEKPDLVFSFGGYLGFPVCLAAKLKNIPVVVHEQTSKPGLANRLTGQFARTIFIAFPEAAKSFPQQKTIVSGNPLRQEIFKIIRQPIQLKEKIPVIYITGGSLGAHSINNLVEAILPKLLQNYYVIHQTGNVQEYGDYYRLSQIKNKRYFPVEHFSSLEIGAIYNSADLIISRAGANTYFELLALKKPALLIPLPWSANHEQQRHAELFQQAGCGEIFRQEKDPQQLLALIKHMLAKIAFYQNNIKQLPNNNPQHAIKIISQTIRQEFTC